MNGRLHHLGLHHQLQVLQLLPHFLLQLPPCFPVEILSYRTPLHLHLHLHPWCKEKKTKKVIKTEKKASTTTSGNDSSVHLNRADFKHLLTFDLLTSLHPSGPGVTDPVPGGRGRPEDLLKPPPCELSQITDHNGI